MNSTKINKRLKNLLSKFIQTNLGNVESLLLNKVEEYPMYPPIFIIGPARSGTTPAYQLFIYSFDLCYFNNIMSKTRLPVICNNITHFFNKKVEHDFKSNYGKTKGLFGPSQGHSIWNKWYTNYNFQDTKKNVTELEKNTIRKTIASIEKSNNAPFINKWPGHSVHLLSLFNVFPDAIFIWIKRDFSFNAQSVLKGRTDLLGDPYKSISRLPKKSEKYKNEHYITQVCEYVKGIHEEIENASKIIGKNRFILVHYEEMCNSPAKIVNFVRKRYGEETGHEINLIRKKFPEFSVSKKRKVSKEDWQNIKNYFNSDIKL